MYAKLIDGKLVEAPNNYRGIINYNRYPERMVEDGYKEVVQTPIPADGVDKYDENTLELIEKASKSYESHYEEQDGRIVQVWNEKEAS